MRIRIIEGRKDGITGTATSSPFTREKVRFRCVKLGSILQPTPWAMTCPCGSHRLHAIVLKLNDEIHSFLLSIYPFHSLSSLFLSPISFQFFSLFLSLFFLAIIFFINLSFFNAFFLFILYLCGILFLFYPVVNFFSPF